MTEINELFVIVTSVSILLLLNMGLVIFKKNTIVSNIFFVRICGIFYALNIVIQCILFYDFYYPYIRLFAPLDLLFLFSIYVFKNQCTGLFLFVCSVLKFKKTLPFMDNDVNWLSLSVLKSIYFCFCLFIALQSVYHQFVIGIFVLVLFLLALTDLIEMSVKEKINLKNIFINQFKYFVTVHQGYGS
jgi:hypothetical protein